jgi:hypothetical protein
MALPETETEREARRAIRVVAESILREDVSTVVVSYEESGRR